MQLSLPGNFLSGLFLNILVNVYSFSSSASLKGMRVSGTPKGTGMCQPCLRDVLAQ